MEIGEFSKQTGLSIDTLRYYNKLGLLVPIKVNGRRRYDEAELEKAAVILKLKNLSFSLDEIKALFELEEDISQDKPLNDASRSSIRTCLDMLKKKYQLVVKQEQDLLVVKQVLSKMINKTDKLLELGYFYNKEEKTR